MINRFEHPHLKQQFPNDKQLFRSDKTFLASVTCCVVVVLGIEYCFVANVGKIQFKLSFYDSLKLIAFNVFRITTKHTKHASPKQIDRLF